MKPYITFWAFPTEDVEARRPGRKAVVGPCGGAGRARRGAGRACSGELRPGEGGRLPGKQVRKVDS